MIRNLRRRIVAINVVLVSLIMFVAVIVTFSMGFARINGERDKRLKAALEFDPTQEVKDESIFNDIVYVKYDVTSEEIVGWYFGSGANLSKDYISGKVPNIVNSQSDSGWIGGKLRYAKVADGDCVKITINSLSGKNSSLPRYMVIVLSAMALGLVGYLVISLMLSKIALHPVEESWTKQKQFVADASHELKTPLSVIMANTEIIASHQNETVESQMKWIENTRSEAQRMADLVADLLFLAKNDDGMTVQMQDTDYSDCVNTIVLGYEAIFYENHKVFQYAISPDLRVFGNDAQLKQLATILLDNANKYSKNDGNIDLRLYANGRHAVLTVSNDSEQMTDEQLGHLFDRFYTVDLSRNRNSGGNGLGLSIAQAICQTHDGSISVYCENSRTTFTVTLPLVRARRNADK